MVVLIDSLVYIVILNANNGENNRTLVTDILFDELAD